MLLLLLLLLLYRAPPDRGGGSKRGSKSKSRSKSKKRRRRRSPTIWVGCAVSVLERRRYGYQFADAVVGRDGQLYFGEDDDLGHLWIYFPSIRGA